MNERWGAWATALPMLKEIVYVCNNGKNPNRDYKFY